MRYARDRIGERRKKGRPFFIHFKDRLQMSWQAVEKSLDKTNWAKLRRRISSESRA